MDVCRQAELVPHGRYVRKPGSHSSIEMSLPHPTENRFGLDVLNKVGKTSNRLNIPKWVAKPTCLDDVSLRSACPAARYHRPIFQKYNVPFDLGWAMSKLLEHDFRSAPLLRKWHDDDRSHY
jgi:hypothetical protein